MKGAAAPRAADRRAGEPEVAWKPMYPCFVRLAVDFRKGVADPTAFAVEIESRLNMLLYLPPAASTLLLES